MRHPNQATLALHAGGDLGPFRSWLTARHLARCAECREEVAGYSEMRELLPELAELPEISWNRMAAEIQANVRLGLEAGECVRSADLPLHRASLTGWRAVVAFASILVLVATCLVLERPVPQPARVAETAVQSDQNGIQLQAGDSILGLMNGGAQKAVYQFGAQGSIGARYRDPETGSVTINTVSYATQ
jgi:anti-sigma factor RsiW